MTFHIYHLVDPTDNVVRYVGRCSDPKARLRNHCNEAQKRQTTPKHRWINALLADNKTPVLVIVGRYTDPIQARDAESLETKAHALTIYNVFDPLKFPSVIAKKGKK